MSVPCSSFYYHWSKCDAEFSSKKFAPSSNFHSSWLCNVEDEKEEEKYIGDAMIQEAKKYGTKPIVSILFNDTRCCIIVENDPCRGGSQLFKYQDVVIQDKESFLVNLRKKLDEKFNQLSIENNGKVKESNFEIKIFTH
jgi:hypothetical protein